MWERSHFCVSAAYFKFSLKSLKNLLLKGTYFGCCFPTHPIHSSMVNLAPQHIILLCWWTVFFCKGLDFTYWCKVLQTRKEEGTGAKESFLLKSSLPISFTLAASGGRYPRHHAYCHSFCPYSKIDFQISQNWKSKVLVLVSVLYRGVVWSHLQVGLRYDQNKVC